ncbi:MAG: carboxypeptidase-like regulatory domain-containing protein, partial [Candidatus Eremiobacteraeota bacterium]|nr:carboxypeptidase-like regulatory domain-containing protein [Candidatus Eremiobacteraeota bacterium]
TGSIDPGLSAELAVRRHSDRLGDLSLSLGHTDQRIDSDVQHDDRATLSGGKSWAHAGVQYLVGLEGTRFAGGTTLNRTAALTLTQSVRNVSLFETFQQASVSGSSGSARQSQFSLGASRPLLGGSATVQFARNASSSGGSDGSSVSQSLSYRRSIGRKLDLQFTHAMQTSFNDGVPTREFDTGISVVRRLSAVVAVQVTGNVFHQTGLGGGHGSAISASLVGPFGFGQPRDGYGHANPKLPAVIRGLVTYSTSATPFAYSASPIRGYNNALIVLDGRISQRTDSTGAFEFRFVSQGTHTIRIDPATISPGLVTDREYATLKVLGGQTASVQFNVGNFAGIAGSVISTDSNGVKHGLPDVGISVDGIQTVTTTPDGHYQIGRLSPGAHTIQIVDATVPSTVAFTGDRKRTVTVTPGTTTPIDFVAAPLGSIAGTVVVPSDGGFGAMIGLKNVYVVAQPGEHAVITDDDGSFLLANLPAATYTLTVDPDTIPDGLSVLSGPDGPLSLGGGGTVSGIVFKLGAGAKEVVYTYSDGRRVPLRITTEPAIAPPGALLRVTARTTAKDVKDLAVESDVFGGFPLHLDARGMWVGTVVVPALVKGDYALTVTAHRKDVTDAATLVPVDPGLPLFTALLSPRNPEPGHTVRVTLKALAPVAEGDAVLFEDGYKILLPKPTGRLFAFDIRLWRKGLPYAASVVTKRGQSYPISLR